tara:strand:- start:1062 stop:1868 length:807 start_codon:yes stop_codon:yes gene_type:complete
MQQIFNILLRYKNFLIYIFLLFLSIVFLSKKSFFHESYINKISLSLSGSIHSVKNKTINYFDLFEKNQILKTENEKLKIYELIYLNQELESSNTINFPFKTIGAKILKNSFTNSRNYLILDKGLKDGIYPEMGVISDDGLIGIINETTENFSSVISILHKDIKLNMKFKKNLSFGSLLWQGESPNKMKLVDIATINPVSIGDTIVTGGMSSYFPEGIPIGTVISFKNTPSGNFYDIDVELFSNLTQKKYVYIIENINSEEIKNLENNE